MKLFRNRRDAGRALANALQGYARRDDIVVLALPRGGVPVAFEVARALGAPLDVFLVRKLGVPWHRELAMGAIATGGVRVMNNDVVDSIGIEDKDIAAEIARESAELTRREALYRNGREPLRVEGRTVIVVDDGLATGASMQAAVAALRARGPRRIIVAVPVAPESTCAMLEQQADEVVCVTKPEDFFAVGVHYEDFSQTTDDEVRTLLSATATPVEHEILVNDLGASLTIPPNARGLIIFAHGSGSSRFSARNRKVAASLRDHGLATLLVDLLTEQEDEIDSVTSQYRFDVAMLGDRVAAVVDWADSEPRTRELPIGVFGASTGAAAALIAVAKRPAVVRAVVSRGGRPDLAGSALPRVIAPTLLIVGSRDEAVLALNREAFARIAAHKDLAIVPGATHLFEEPGALEIVASHAANWFTRHLGRPSRRPSLTRVSHPSHV